MKVFNKILNKRRLVNLLPILSVGIVLASPVMGDTGYECLGLSDQEMRGKQLKRVLGHVNDFFVKHEARVLQFKAKCPHEYNSILAGQEVEDDFSERTKKAITKIRQNKETSIGQDYREEPQLLREHLNEIKEVLGEGPSDLNVDEIQELKSYANLLLFISKF